MTNQQDILELLRNSHRALMGFKKYFNDSKFKEWKSELSQVLSGSSKVKINRLQLQYVANSYVEPYIDEHEVKIAEAVIKDAAFKCLDKKSKEDLESLKILKAREENIDFESELAEMICGDTGNFPYRSSMYLTEFFQNLGHSFTHEGETRGIWVKERLEELTAKEIQVLISKGLFRKKYFTDFNKDQRTENISFSEAINEFKAFMDNSITANDAFDLSNVLDMNVNIELLFDQQANTEDIELNKLIEEARERFLQNDKQVALEKLWAAFERVKTYYLKEEAKKNLSANRLVEQMSENFEKEFIEKEFYALKDIGNGYRIRHHETDKRELTLEHRNYFFFRMLSLIDLCLVFLNKQEEEEDNNI